jgi:hypothetical protein
MVSSFPPDGDRGSDISWPDTTLMTLENVGETGDCKYDSVSYWLAAYEPLLLGTSNCRYGSYEVSYRGYASSKLIGGSVPVPVVANVA